MFKFVNSDTLNADVSANIITSFKALSQRHWYSGCDLRYTKTFSTSQIKVYLRGGGI